MNKYYIKVEVMFYYLSTMVSEKRTITKYYEEPQESAGIALKDCIDLFYETYKDCEIIQFTIKANALK